MLFCTALNTMDKQLISIKQRYGIIGFNSALEYAIHIAVQVAPTDLSVLITGESGVGKESFPKIIHENSAFKHGQYIAVNCGAIPEGTIDSELFGHEKGAFTGATEARKGYFEVADGGTIFLDEVADLPLSTQVRLLRVLENGEFFKVGSSKPQKTKVRVVAATNVNIAEKIVKGKFREDLYYRLNSVPIHIPPLRDRKEDVFLLFTKFATDFAFKYQIPPLLLTDEAKAELIRYAWPGNVRQLRNITEQMSLIEKERMINIETLANYLVATNVSNLPALMVHENDAPPQFFERELIYKFLSDLTKEVAELKILVNELKSNKTRLPEGKTVTFTDFDPIDIQEEAEILEEKQKAKKRKK
jgi:transcriptional regulator with PAS, ATPase and Fis domain